MFKCKKCGKIDDFIIMFNPSYKGKKEYSKAFDKNGVLSINVDGYVFTPGLDFMNSHAVCRYCGEINNWISS